MNVKKNENQTEQSQSKERKNNRLNLRITDSEIAGLHMVSFNDDEPVSQIVRKAIRMYVNMRKNTY